MSLPVVARACKVVFSAFRFSWSSFWEDDDFSFYRQHPWIGVVSCGLHWFGVLGARHPWEWLPLLLRRRCITFCSRYDLKKPVVLIPQRMQESLTAERVRSGVPFVSQSKQASSSSTTSSDFGGVPTPFELLAPKALALFGSNAASLSASGLSDPPFVIGLGFSPVAGKMVAQIIFGKYVDLNDWAEPCCSLALGSVFGSFRTSRLVVFPRWVLQVLEQAPYSVCCFALRCSLCSGVHRVLVHPQSSNKSSKDDGKLRATSPESSSSTSSNKSHCA